MYRCPVVLLLNCEYLDIWRSTFPIDPSFSETCEVPLSGCGRVGLQCLPTDDTSAATTMISSGITTISCTACPAKQPSPTPTPSSSSNNLALIFLFIFLSLFLLM